MDLPANAATFRIALADTGVAMALAALAATHAQRERNAIVVNERARHRALEGGRPVPRTKEWHEGLTAAKAEQMAKDLFDAGRWDCLLAQHYAMVRLARETDKSASLKVHTVHEPSDLSQIEGAIERLTDQVNGHAPETGSENLARQVAVLRVALDAFCPVGELPPAPLKGGLS